MSVVSRARPMSASFATPSVVIMMFLGLTSRWIRPWAWACSRAWQTWMMISMRLLLAEDLAVGEIVGDGLALDVLHDEVVVAAGLADVDGLDDVGVVELAGGLAFLVEALDVLGVLAEALGQDLDRDDAVEAELLGLVDDGHRAGPELAEDLVAGDLLGGDLALPDAGLEPLRLAGRDVPQLDHEVLEHEGIDLAAFLVFLDGLAQLFIRAEPLVHRHPSEQRVVTCFGCHRLSPGCPQGPHPFARKGSPCQRIAPPNLLNSAAFLGHTDPKAHGQASLPVPPPLCRHYRSVSDTVNRFFAHSDAHTRRL